MLEKIKTNINSIIFSKAFKKTIFLGFFAFLFYSFWVDFAFAASNKENSDLAWNVAYLVEMLQHLIAMSASIIGWLTAIISVLLDPSWTNWTLFQISKYLKEIWIFVSNVVYLIFAWLLIIISFANIIGKWTGDIFELKKSLPKFIIWVLIVPFSWFLVQLVISMSSILTVSIYTWPLETLWNMTSPNILEKDVKDWCTKRVINLQWSTISKWTDISDDVSTSSWFFVCKTEQTTNLKDILYWWVDWEISIWWAIGLYSFGIMEVWTLDKFKSDDLGHIKSLMQLWAKGLFDIAFILIYLVILIALFIALFIRVIALWIFMVASPLFWLLYFSSKSLGKMWEKFNFKEFFWLAMVPVYVAAALSFWLMFLFVIWQWLAKDTWENKNFNLDKFQIWTVTIEINWSAAGSVNKDNVFSTIFWELKSLLWYLMLKMFGLAFLWMAVMAALKQSTITWNMIKPIEDFGWQVGKFVMESPKYIPIPGTNGLSFDWAMNVWNQVMTKIKQSSNDKAREWWQKNVSFLSSEEQKKLWKELSESMTLGVDKSLEKLKDILYKYEEKDQFMYKDKIAELMKRSWLEWAEKIEQAKTPEEFAKAMMEINNNESNRGKNKWEYILWKKIDDPETVNQELWSKKWSGDSKTDATSLTINYNVSWVIEDKENGGSSIKQWRENDFLNSLRNDLELQKWKIDIEKVMKELTSKFWIDDKDRIKTIIKTLFKEQYFKTDEKYKWDGDIETKIDKLLPWTTPPTNTTNWSNWWQTP